MAIQLTVGPRQTQGARHPVLVSVVASCLAFMWVAGESTVAQDASVLGGVAQGEERFEAISIRRSATLEDRVTGAVQPNGRVALRGVTPYWLIAFSYNGMFTAERIVGEPAWSRRERFDIEATSAHEPKDVRLSLQAMLRDRFQFHAHAEKREIPVYALLRRSDGKLGPGLRPASVDCSDKDAVAKAEAEKKADEFICRGRAGANSLSFRALPIKNLLTALGSRVQRPVIDRTGLTGYFDIDLEWSPTLETTDALAQDRVSIFTAVQEQLGLRLQSDKDVQDVLVIDSIDRPSEN
jgi:uncharacterized protein (TIGR03435 family)